MDDSDTTPSSPSSISSPPPRALRHTSTRRPKPQSTTSLSSSEQHHRHHHRHHHDYTKTHRALHLLTTERLTNETIRANAAEQRLSEALATLRSVVDTRNRALEDLARTTEELRLWKVQLDNARAEMDKAHDVMARVERERDEALAEAARDRSKARQLMLEKAVWNAREEGWALGYKEGLQVARRARGEMPKRSLSARLRLDEDDEDTIDDRRISGRSRSPLSIMDTAHHAPTLPVQTVVSPQRMASPMHSRVPSPIRPIAVSGTTAAHIHPPVAIPQDGYIPEADAVSLRITLPAPHDLEARVPSPGRPSSGVIRSRDFAYAGDAEVRVLSVPPPPVLLGESRLRSPASTESTTRLSQCDLVGSPHGESVVRPLSVTRSRRGSPGVVKEKSPPQQIAEEWRSANPDMASTSYRASPQVQGSPRSSLNRAFRQRYMERQDSGGAPLITVQEPSESSSSSTGSSIATQTNLLSPSGMEQIVTLPKVEATTPMVVPTAPIPDGVVYPEPRTPTYATAPIPDGVVYPEPRTPTYATAPIPDGVVYPEPRTPRYATAPIPTGIVYPSAPLLT